MAGSVLRVTFDTNAVNLLVDQPGAFDVVKDKAKQAGIVFVAHHVVEDELFKTSNIERRARLLEAFDIVSDQFVVTHGLVLDHSRADQARLGDGSESGICVEEVTTKGRGAIEDALIGTTASGQADIIVTDDNDLIEKIQLSPARCELWKFEQFIQFLSNA